MGDAVSNTPDEREKKNNEVGQLYSPVDAQSRQHKGGEPQHIERYEARIAPIVSEQPWELMLKASCIFFREMKALDRDREQVGGKNYSSVALPPSRYPHGISQDQTATQKNNGGTHPAGLHSQHDQHEDCANDTVTQGNRVYAALLSDCLPSWDRDKLAFLFLIPAVGRLITTCFAVVVNGVVASQRFWRFR